MKRLAVLGHPVAHSRSPAMQNAALAELGLSDEWFYEAIDLAPDEFEHGVRAMPADGFVGANVTVPHKGAALVLADSFSETACEIGAANTLSFTGDGEIHAENTDAGGLLDALPEEPGGKRALVLGAGGAARAVVWALVREGAAVEVWNRTGSRAQGLCAELGGEPVEAPDAAAYELIVNSTAVGLRGEDPFEELPLSYSDLGPRQIVVDFVYGPGGTQLLTTAKHARARVVDGIEILVHQGARSLEIWTGREAPREAMYRAAMEGLSR